MRLWVLQALLVVSTVLGILHQAAKDMQPVGVDALDPFGGIEALITFVLSGALQELAGRLGRAIFGRRRPVVPQVIDRPGRYLKYLVRAVIVAGSAATASLFIRPYDPWAAWHRSACGMGSKAGASSAKHVEGKRGKRRCRAFARVASRAKRKSEGTSLSAP